MLAGRLRGGEVEESFLSLPLLAGPLRLRLSYRVRRH